MILTIVLFAGGAFLLYSIQKKETAEKEKKQIVTALQSTETSVFEFLYMMAREGRWPHIISPQYIGDIHGGFSFNADTRSALFLLRLYTTDRQPLSNESSQQLGTVIQADLKWAVSHGELNYLPKVISVYHERGSVFIRMEVAL